MNARVFDKTKLPSRSFSTGPAAPASMPSSADPGGAGETHCHADR